MKNLCKKVLKYLEHSSTWKEYSTGQDECMLLNYWIYDNLSSYYGNDNTEKINIAFSALQLIWSYLVTDSREKSYYNKCKPLFNELLNYDDWKKRKELYDYCINYELISQMCPFFDKKCVEYCQYIEKTKESGIYDHFETICSSEKGNCPHFYRICEKYNPKTVLNTLNCTERVKAQEKLTRGAGDVNQLQEQEVEAAASAHGTEETNETSGIGINVTNSVLGAAPVLLTATALYRYTPLGPWIRRFRGGRTNNMNTMDTFSPYTPETGDMFSEESANYISYQPM
ncbi:variable surface protein Vir4, putative [Plasmodium vivax]|uniref:Variable surface protein Vir4, putative n=1 Tax=Plasmodium vivax (strain Salvador I) TaxID=126793 RepID=A5KD89_PLAVS|nr:variable surface protein Vir4, putative [Plasmodium vivax]EDL42680.1 variable surface protein Vir4, putative [Plasmodium vivax]|eukprot:XP_001612473.1 variable surface protein Vir4 [Plasmodium vivax Sal-1]